MSRRFLLLALPVLWVAVLVSAIAVVRERHESRALFAELERLSAERDLLNIEWSRLQLEQSAWSNHAFVERVAHDRLGMDFPDPRAIEIVAP